MSRKSVGKDLANIIEGTRADLEARIRTLSIQVRTWRNVAAIAAADPLAGRGESFRLMVSGFGYVGNLPDMEADELRLRNLAFEAAVVCGAAQSRGNAELAAKGGGNDRSEKDVDLWIANLERALAMAKQERSHPTQPGSRSKVVKE